MTLQVRTAVVRGALEAAETIEAWPKIRALLPADVLGVTEDADMRAWLPFRTIASLDDAIMLVCGERTVEDVHCRAANPTLRHPLFKPLVEGAFRFFSRTPTALLRWAPGALRMSLRGANDLSYEQRSSGCRLTMRDPPTEILSSASWRAGTRGSLRGIVELVGFEATVVETCSATAIIHDITWTLGSSATRAP